MLKINADPQSFFLDGYRNSESTIEFQVTSNANWELYVQILAAIRPWKSQQMAEQFIQMKYQCSLRHEAADATHKASGSDRLQLTTRTSLQTSTFSRWYLLSQPLIN